MKDMRMIISTIFLLLSIVILIFSAFLLSPKTSCLSEVEPPGSWFSDDNIFALTNSTPSFWETKIYIQRYGENQNNSIGKIFFRDSSDTGSMEPTMFGGNKLIVLKILNKDLIEPGDIIGFRAENRTIVHRVITKDYEWNGTAYTPFFRTKGDHCMEMDPWKVKPDDIEGVVVGVLY